MKLIEIAGETGLVEIDGIRKSVSLVMIDRPQIGSYVLVHAGFALQQVDEEEAEKTLKLLREYAELKQKPPGEEA